jgi:hypothetical protein
MFCIGLTIENKQVLGGIGKLFFQEGIPLSIIFDGCREKEVIPSWLHLYDELKGNGMSHKRIIHTLNEHIFESYGKEFRDVVINRLNKIKQHERV